MERSLDKIVITTKLEGNVSLLVMATVTFLQATGKCRTKDVKDKICASNELE